MACSPPAVQGFDDMKSLHHHEPPSRELERRSWCSKARLRQKSMENKSAQTAASKPNLKQERRLIRKEAKGSQLAGKRGGDRATSNAQ